MTLPRAKQTKIRVAVVASIALLTSGCATAPGGKSVLSETFASGDPCSNNARNIGIVAGVIGGAILEKVIQGKSGRKVPVVGMALGAAIGGLIGADIDRRRCELSLIAKNNNLDVLMSDIQSSEASFENEQPNTPGLRNSNTSVIGMSLNVIDQGTQFDTGSATPSIAARKVFGEIAEKYHIRPDVGMDKNKAAARNASIRILLIGHTDDTGPSKLNADLSENRAKAIAAIFAEHGFSRSQIFFQGAGETLPIADNNTEEGRAKNRRVEIVDLGSDEAFTAFLEARRPNTSFYRPASPALPAGPAPVMKEIPIDKNFGRKAGKETSSSSAFVAKKTAPAMKTASNAAEPISASSNETKGSPKPVVKQPQSIEIDFGGIPAVSGQFKTVDIGKPTLGSRFSIFSQAYASDDRPMGSCAEDRPRISHGVKSLANDSVLKTSEYLPGAASATWGDSINGNYVGISGVSVLRESGLPPSLPTIKIWKNYTKGTTAKPDYVATPEVNAYRGDKALLYRVFMTSGPIRCLDMVIPNKTPNTAPESNIVYEKSSMIFQASYSPSIVR